MKIYVIWEDDRFDDDRSIKAITLDSIEATELAEQNLNRIVVYDSCSQQFIEVDRIGNYISVKEGQWRQIQ